MKKMRGIVHNGSCAGESAQYTLHSRYATGTLINNSRKIIKELLPKLFEAAILLGLQISTRK